MVVQCTERATGREFAVKKIAVRQYVLLACALHP
jgi:hypothetical protein